MATNGDPITDVHEHCDGCDRVTPHRATVRIRTESAEPENAAFSREPYRVSECRICGRTETTRMNNA
jgi:hypothetical protein